jgi:hypothetical protein
MIHDHRDEFNQLLILRDTLYRSNFKIMELVKTRENITISREEQPKTILIPYPIRFLNEKGKFHHIYKKFKAIIRDELDDDKTVQYDTDGDVIEETLRKWTNFDDMKKIIHSTLWMLYKKVLQRIQALWDGDIKNKKNDEKIWYEFNLSSLNVEKSIKIAEENWMKFKRIIRQIFVGSWKQEKFITEEEANNLNDLDIFKGNFFIKGEERIGTRKVIENTEHG